MYSCHENIIQLGPRFSVLYVYDIKWWVNAIFLELFLFIIFLFCEKLCSLINLSFKIVCENKNCEKLTLSDWTLSQLHVVIFFMKKKVSIKIGKKPFSASHQFLLNIYLYSITLYYTLHANGIYYRRFESTDSTREREKQKEVSGKNETKYQSTLL